MQHHDRQCSRVRFGLRMIICAAALCLIAVPQTVQANDACFPSLIGFLKGEIEAGKYPGDAMLVDRGGTVILDTRHGHLTPDKQKPVPADAIFRFYSMTKPVTSVAAMMLHEQGKLDIDDPLSDTIPEFGTMQVHTADGLVAAERPITIRDLLRHTSGITYSFFGQGAVRDAYKAAKIGAPTVSSEQSAKDIAGLPLEHQPGTTWEYSRSTDVLGRVIEVVSGEPLDEFFKQHILTPLGMTDTDFFVAAAKRDRFAGSYSALPDYATKPIYLEGGGGLVSTMADYLKFLRMLRSGGELDGVRLLQSDTVDAMRSDQLFGNGIKPGKYYFVGYGHGFGLGFAVKLADHPQAWPGPVGTYWWVGYAGTLFWVDPANDLIAIFLVQTTDGNLARWGSVRGLFYKDFGLDGSTAAACLSG